jgi:tetratricopeptide (TPR) repeat protein
LAGLNRALSLFREADDLSGAAETLCSLSSGSGVFADDDDAERDYAEQALADAQRDGDEALIGRALARLAPSLPGDEREVTLTRAAELLDRVGDHREIAGAYNNAAYQTLREGQPERADVLLVPALSAAERVGDAWNLIVIHGTAGLTKVVLGDHDQARQHLRLQLELSIEHGLRHNGDGVIGLAAIEARRGDYDAAARLVGIARGLGYPPTKHDITMDERLVRDFLAPAMRAYGEGQWRCAERNGAAMPYPKAIAYALGEKGPADVDRSVCTPISPRGQHL